MTIDSEVKLNDGWKMPILGFGLSQIPNGEPARQAVTWALEAGYRHIDTAWLYRNESSVGKAVKDAPLPREDIWITTKLYPNQFINPRKAIERSLRKLDMEYVDLYLIHWPLPLEVTAFDKKLWRAMESFKEEGLCRSIGVSNYLPDRLGRLLSYANIPPCINQVHFSPLHFSHDLYKYCEEVGIKIVGYRPLGRGSGLANQQVLKIADMTGKTPSQIMLRWAIQKGIIPIPRSSKYEHILENAKVFNFSLNPDDREELDTISGSL